ncbi:MAG: glycosyltransferase family 2 protein [Candidatus Diapherotrites archaeon]|nr:glycosyltransferase family 2 protein [Candidatus Diapherotrites archaeon]
MRKKAVIVIAAFNEEESLGRTLDLIKATRLPAQIILVNDGSTDKTRAIALAKGAQVIDMVDKTNQSKNRGKANAIFAGLRAALKFNPTSVVTLDADMLTVPRVSLKELIDSAHTATRIGKIAMHVAPYAEGTFEPHTYLSGLRSFSIPALHYLHKSKFKSIPRGYGLETFLGIFFSKFRQNTKGSFQLEPGFRSSASKQHQKSDIALTRKRITKRFRPRFRLHV